MHISVSAPRFFFGFFLACIFFCILCVFVCVFLHLYVFVWKRQTGLVPQAITVLKHLYLITLRERGLKKEREEEEKKTEWKPRGRPVVGKDGQIKQRRKRAKRKTKTGKYGKGCLEVKKCGDIWWPAAFFPQGCKTDTPHGFTHIFQRNKMYYNVLTLMCVVCVCSI